MQKIYLTLLVIISCNFAWAQGENCSGAVLLTNGVCVAGTPGTSQNIVGCVGNADDDSWYRFVATQSSHSLTVTGSGGYDAVLQVFSGTGCGALVSTACIDNTFTNGAESTVVTGLIPGNTYYVRTYHYFAGSAGAFTMCFNNAPAAPANNNCASAINLTANAACVQTAGTTFAATTETLYPACAGTANDDVWYSFTATNYTQTIQVAGSASMDPVIELFSGSCGSFTSLSCTDNTFSGGTETVLAGGLTPGATYFFRVYDYYSGSGSTFSVCVSGTSIIAGSQPNDEPCSAILLPPVTADCNYSTFSNVGATLSSVASPTNCLGGTGGFGATTKDVWFAIVVPASGNLCITPQPNLTGAVITDGVMALYSGSCGSLTQIACSDDADGAPVGNFNYPGTANDFLPYINQTGLTPGTTVYLRYWGWGSEAGSFGICVQAPTNDLCANALYICDINGYSASTSPAYTPDRPGTGAGQMYGNNETAAGVNQPDGTNTGGIFGYYPPSNIAGPYSAPAIDVNIENNSWIRFSAASPTISLRVNVYDCWENGGSNQGVQMQIFSGTNCTNFAPVSTFQEGIGTYTLSATGLTVGNTYYLMVDGWGGNICNYNIQAIAGVAFPEITAIPGSICPGQTSTLTAPSGATGYTWEPTGQTTQTISVAPGTTMTYTCYVGGVCGYKQTLTKTVTMLAAPSVSINSGAAITTCGTQTITLTGGGASTYSWSTGNTSASFTVAPPGSQSYSVIGTAANGCTNTAVTNVTVNTVPTIVPTTAGSNTICNGNSANLTVSGANTYTWSPAATLSSSTGTAVTATPTTGTNYTIIGTAVNGCTNSATYSVTVNAKPPIGSSTTGSVVCNGSTTSISGTGGVTYTWVPTITNGVAFTPTASTVYTVIGTAANGCTNTATQGITVTALPSLTVTASNSTLCLGNSTNLTASGASTYTWSNGVANSAAFSPTSTATYTVIATAAGGCTNTAVRTITVNTLPTVSSTVTNSVICNGQSTTLSGTGTASTYTWTGSVTNGVSFSPSSTNSYTVTGTDANGCTNTSVRGVTVNPLPTVSPSASSLVICNGGSTTLTGAGTAHTYTWTGGISNGVAFNPSSTNTYTVTGTNTLTGCTNTAQVTVTVSTVPTVTVNPANSVICTGSSAVLSAGGASTYTWSNGVVNGGSFSPTSTGTYTVIGTAANGCTNTAVKSITVNSLPAVAISVISNSICTGQTTTLSANGATTYTWTSPVSTNTVITVSPASTTSYTVAGTDLNGCINTSVRTITVNSIPTSTASTTGIITCVTNTVSLNSNLAGANYTWTAPGGSSISGTANNQNAIGQGQGTYTLNIMSAAGCSYSTTVAANVNTTPPTASATGGTLTCANTSTVLTGGPTSGVTYSWSGPGILGSTTSANVTATLVGTYSLVTTSTTNGCSSSVAAIATVTNNLTTPTVTAGSNQTITCAAPSVTLSGSATPGSNYSWSNGATTSTTTVGGSGTYTLTATNPATGCSSVSTVYVAPSAGTPNGSVASVTGSITCSNTTMSLSISTTVTPVTILWTGPGITGPTNTPSTTVSQGNVTYTVTLTNASMCSQSYPVFVPQNTNPVTASASVAATASITCATTTLILSSTPTGTNYAYSWTGPGTILNGTTANPTVNTGGTYSLTVTDIVTGCSGPSGSTTVFVPTNNTAPTLTLSANSVTTTCGNPGTTIIASSNSNPHTTYTWTAPATGTINSTSVSNPSIGGSGVFTVAITNTVSGCPSVPQTVTVTADANVPTFTLSATSTIVNCTNPTPGVTINTTPSGLSYSWSPTPNSGGNTASPTFTAGGTYTCLVTNTTNSCSTNVPVVTVGFDKTLPTANATPASSVTCTNTSVAISSTVTPATDVTYNWTGPNIISGTATLNPTIGLGGNYVIAMTNTLNGCTNSYTVNVPVNTTVPSLNIAANSLITSCAVPSETFNASSNAASPSYSWTAPAGGSLSSNTSSNPTVSGSGIFTVTVTDAVNGCVSASQTATLTADANIPTFNLSSNTAVITCAVSNPTVSLSSPVSGVTYSWSPTPASGITTASPTFTAVGSYTCLITNPTNSCSTSGAVVNVTDDLIQPTATASTNSSITCSTTSLSISSIVTPTSNVTYNWSGPNVISGAASLNPVVGAGGDYVIAMTNTVNGCTNTYTTTVLSNTTLPQVNLAANAFTINCTVQSASLAATSPSDPSTTYSWTSPSTGTISNTGISNPVVGGSGVFTVAVTNTANGCVSATQTVNVTSDIDAPTYSLQSNTATINCIVPSPSVSLTSTVTGVTYSWNPVPASGATTASPTFTATGNYTCTITNPANNCTNSNAQVFVDSDTTPPVVNIAQNLSVTCNSSTIALTAVVLPTNSTYVWAGIGITGSVNGSSVTVIAGTYSLTVTDPGNGCSNSDIASVGTNTIQPNLNVSATSTVISCSTASSTLSANSPSGIPTWVIPGGASATNSVIATVAGNYTITVIDNANGCRRDSIVTIIGNTVLPDANAGVATAIPCNTSSVTLLGSSTTTDVVIYNWAGPGAGSITSASNISNPTVISAGVYTLTVTNAFTGCSQSATVNVTQNNVTADFTADPMTGEAPLNVNVTNSSIGATTYDWNFGNGATSTATNSSTVYNDEGTYTITLIASNGGCSDTTIRVISVEDGFTIEIPNVFTPNGDGVNELFHIKTTGVKSAEGFIYNRWGQLLYSWDVLNVSWDGNASNGENCPDGTYYYLIKVIDKKDKEHIAPGYVLIAR